MSEEKTEVAKVEDKALATGGSFAPPPGLDNLGADDLLMPKIKVWHPMSTVEIDGIKLGEWYEQNAAANLGKSLKFVIISQKNRHYDNVGDDGETVRKHYKHLLVVTEANPDVPTEIVLSASGIRAVKALNTTLITASLKKGNGAPAFTFLIEGTIKVTDGKKGKYGVPQFTIAGDTPEGLLASATEKYQTLAEDYANDNGGVDTATAYKGD